MKKKNWYNLSVEDTANLLNTNLTTGLTEAGAAERIEKYGYNELKQGKKKTFLQKFLAQFKDTMIIILILAAVISGVVGILESKEPVTSVFDFLQKISDSFIILLIVIVKALPTFSSGLPPLSLKLIYYNGVVSNILDSYPNLLKYVKQY